MDESSTNAALSPRYGRAPKGERAHGKHLGTGEERDFDLFDQRGGYGGLHEPPGSQALQCQGARSLREGGFQRTLALKLERLKEAHPEAERVEPQEEQAA